MHRVYNKIETYFAWNKTKVRKVIFVLWEINKEMLRG